MVLILGLLALIPLSALISLHWHICTGERGCVKKAVWFSFTAAFFWSWLGDYISTLHPRWGWISYLLLVLGTLYFTACVWICSTQKRRRRYSTLALVGFPLVFLAAAWIVPQSVWTMISAPTPVILDLTRILGSH